MVAQNAALSACEKGHTWPWALHTLEALQSQQVGRDVDGACLIDICFLDHFIDIKIDNADKVFCSHPRYVYDFFSSLLTSFFSLNHNLLWR